MATDREISLAADKTVIVANGNNQQLYAIVIEELAELIQEVSKFHRNKGDYYDLLQEIADVEICIKVLQKISKTSDETLARAITAKLRGNAAKIQSELQENSEE